MTGYARMIKAVPVVMVCYGASTRTMAAVQAQYIAACIASRSASNERQLNS